MEGYSPDGTLAADAAGQTGLRTAYFCYTSHMDSFLSVQKYLPHAEYVDTSPSAYAYWDELAKRWDGSADLLIVEQHIVVHDQVLPQMRECRRDWCLFPAAQDGGSMVHGMGCTRFSAALQRRVPPLAIRMRARRKCPHCGALHFNFIDGPVTEALQAAGYTAPHVHNPPVRHLPE